jgi:predicted ribosomally synthesized peptide with nif11-like leader
MSEEQLSALLAKLKDDAGLREKLKGAADLDAAVAFAKEAGFDVSKADWLRYQAKQTLELSDEELERAAGGCTANSRTGETEGDYCACMTGFHSKTTNCRN